MGRPRKPTILKLIHSSYRTDRDIKDIPETQAYEISVPAFVLPEALQYFEDIATHVNCMKIIMPVDCFKIGVLANDMLHYENITKAVLNNYTTMGQYEAKRNPLLMQENHLRESINTGGKAYGFDPQSRIGLPIEVEEALKAHNDTRSSKVSGFEDKWSSI